MKKYIFVLLLFLVSATPSFEFITEFVTKDIDSAT